jgi:CelD/BcsL family acetyltransferase involved in cellulose biosynthesis
MTYEHVVAQESAERAHYEWAELADLVGADPFLHPGWFDAWRSAFGDRGFEVLAVRRAGRLVGLLPVEAPRAGILRSPVNEDTPRYGALVLDREAANALARHLIRSGPRRLDLSYVPGDDPLYAALGAAGDSLLTHHLTDQPYVDLSVDAETYEAALPRKLRQDLRRRRRRLDEQGAVAFDVHDGSESLRDLLVEGFAVEAASWKGERGCAISSTVERTRFYTELAEWAAARGWLRLAYLRVDGRAIAFSIFLRTETHVWALKLGVDPEFRSAGAGVLLTWESLRRWLGRGLASFEFLGNADPFKLMWTNTTRPVARVQLFGSSVGGAIEGALWRNAEGLLARVPRVGPLRNGPAPLTPGG